MEKTQEKAPKAPEVKQEAKGKQHKRPKKPKVANTNKENEKEKKAKETFLYEATELGLPIYGVIVQWVSDSKQKYSTNAVMAKLEPLLEPYRFDLDKGDEQVKTLSLKRKTNPYFQRKAPGKGVVYFDNMKQANKFAQLQGHPEFTTFIPMSYVSTVGKATCNKSDLKGVKMQQLLPIGFKAMQWRQRGLKDDPSKVEVTMCVRGTMIPTALNAKGKEIKFDLHKRQPAHCERCLRYGHLTRNCLRKPRCGVCSITKNFSWKHSEWQCKTIQKHPDIVRCRACEEGHSIGTSEKCPEHVQQCDFKMRLVRYKMDWISVIHHDVLAAVRATPINSDRTFLCV